MAARRRAMEKEIEYLNATFGTDQWKVTGDGKGVFLDKGHMTYCVLFHYPTPSLSTPRVLVGDHYYDLTPVNGVGGAVDQFRAFFAGYVAHLTKGL
jgi:hypothetical protein